MFPGYYKPVSLTMGEGATEAGRSRTHHVLETLRTPSSMVRLTGLYQPRNIVSTTQPLDS